MDTTCPSKQGVTFDEVPGQLQMWSRIRDDADLPLVVMATVALLNDLPSSRLLPDVLWRDLLALTGSYRTLDGSECVHEAWKKLAIAKGVSNIRPRDSEGFRIEKSGEASWLDVDIEFQAKHHGLTESCAGTVSLVCGPNGVWKIWVLRTWLECFIGHGHPDEPSHVPGTVKVEPDGSAVAQYDAVVVGGGQSGLSVAGRLQALRVSYVLLERHADIGDVWAQRYESLKWHTTKEFGNLPFGHTYPIDDEYLMPTRRIAAGHKSWAERYGLYTKTGASVQSAAWNSETQMWIVKVSIAGHNTLLHARNLVLATGTGLSKPAYPDWASSENVKASGFRGIIKHAFEGYGSGVLQASKKGLVIGTANTGHDVAEDMANGGIETTIIQRNATFVLPAEWLHAASDALYHPNMDTGDADGDIWTAMRMLPERFDALEKAGFLLDRFGDVYNNLYVRRGGHYVDTGCSARISNGEIKVKQALVERLTQDGLLFRDGSSLNADLIVLCTGFENDIRREIEHVIGAEAAAQMDDIWGLDAGEVRGLAKPNGYPNLYYMGGDVRMSRFFSRFLALQIQADCLGSPLGRT